MSVSKQNPSVHAGSIKRLAIHPTDIKKFKHIGLHKNRLHRDAGNPIEVKFAQSWEAENRVQLGRPTPLIANLLGPDFTQRDATVAATIIQWLGSHVGQSFLTAARMSTPRHGVATQTVDISGASATMWASGVPRRGQDLPDATPTRESGEIAVSLEYVGRGAPMSNTEVERAANLAEVEAIYGRDSRARNMEDYENEPHELTVE